VAAQTTDTLDGEVVDFFTDPDARADPHRFWRRLRTEAPVYRSEGLGQWIVSGYPEAHAVFQRASKEVSYSPRSAPGHDPARIAGSFREVMYDVHLPRTDPPQHTRVRGAVRRPFSGPAAEQWRAPIRTAASELIGDIERGATFDFMKDVAEQVPTRLTCALFGLPLDDAPLLDTFLAGFVGLLEPEPSPAAEIAGRQAGEAFTAYLEPIIERRNRGEGEPTVLDNLIIAEQAGAMTRPGITSFILMVMVGGHDTVAGALGNALWRFHRAPSQWRRIVADPSLVTSATEEILRYENPLHLVATKYLFEDFALGDHVLPKGAAIRVSLAGANRDPRQFSDPETFDVGRADNRHLGLGFGPHFCLGGFLGRVEIQEFLTALADRNPVIEIDEDGIEWGRGLVHFGPHSMPMSMS
jgi:cytochrome P450